MSQKLTDALVKAVPSPAAGNRIAYDADVKGFGCNGAKAFVINYRTRAGRERRYTIGSFPDWSVSAARTEARHLKQRVDRGEDPMGEFESLRAAPTVADLCQRFKEEHLPRLRPSTSNEYAAQIAKFILPALRNHKVAEVTYSDVDAIHRKITKHAPYRANRAVTVLAKMFSLAIKWGYRSDNPAKAIERNQEIKRRRYLSGDELRRLSIALASHPNQTAANIVRLLLLTGARRGEVLGMRWDQLDLETGMWIKPGSLTKQKVEHRVPLSAPARQLLIELRAVAPGGATFVFPGPGTKGHRVSPDIDWAAICAAAGIVNARLHDLRHTYASLLVSSGLSLPVIGALLGHSQPQTTARYAHLFDDPLRAATERVGAIVTSAGKPSAEVVQDPGLVMGDPPKVVVVGGTEAEGRGLADDLNTLIEAHKTLRSELEAAQQSELEVTQRIEEEDRDDPLARDTALNIARKGRALETLHAIRRCLQLAGTPLELIAPLPHVAAGLTDSIEGRSNDLLKPIPMKAGTSTKPIQEAQSWSAAAAAATVLKGTGLYSLDGALRAAAMATGATQKQISNFRKELTSERASTEAIANYKATVELILADSEQLSPRQLANKAIITLTAILDLS